MTNIIPSVIQDNGEYYIHMEEYKKVKELGEHYKHLYSELKRQKDEITEYIKSFEYYIPEDNKIELLKKIEGVDDE